MSAGSPIGGGGENTPGTSGVVGAGGDMAVAGGNGLFSAGGGEAFTSAGGGDFPPDGGEDLESGGGGDLLSGGGDDGGGEDGGGEDGGDELPSEEGGDELLLLLLPEGAESGDEAICKKYETQFRPSIRLGHRPEINLTHSPLTTRHFDSAPLYIKKSDYINTLIPTVVVSNQITKRLFGVNVQMYYAGHNNHCICMHLYISNNNPFFGYIR